MNEERIKEIQQETAYPESISVQQALLKVWNEVEQSKNYDDYTDEELIKIHDNIVEENNNGK